MTETRHGFASIQEERLQGCITRKPSPPDILFPVVRSLAGSFPPSRRLRPMTKKAPQARGDHVCFPVDVQQNLCAGVERDGRRRIRKGVGKAGEEMLGCGFGAIAHGTG